MKNIYRKIQVVSNIANVVLTLLLSIIVLKLFLMPSISSNQNPIPISTIRTVPNNNFDKPKQNSPKINPVGQIIPIQEIEWKKKNLVLYISTKCRYCSESSPFYKQLTTDNKLKNVNFVAIAPQVKQETTSYLEKLEIGIKDIYSMRLASIGVTATPTLLLVDESGTVLEMWRGMLSENEQKEVINKLMS